MPDRIPGSVHSGPGSPTGPHGTGSPSGVRQPSFFLQADSTLLASIHAGRRLLFTRNCGIDELRDILQRRILRSTKQAFGFRDAKYFRYGLGHEYGQIVVVMKEDFFWEENGRSAVRNLFVSGKEAGGKALDGREVEKVGCHIVIGGQKIAPHEADAVLSDLAARVQYNVELPAKTRVPDSLKQPGDTDRLAGQTVALEAADRYMGHLPQIEAYHDIPISMVERILVPEHLWDMVSPMVPADLLGLAVKVEGTGKTETEFLHNKGKLRRRSRADGGSIAPQFGEKSFHLFEVAYFSTIVGTTPLSFAQKAKLIYIKHGYWPFERLPWLDGYPEVQRLVRPREDWSIFVQPGEKNFLAVLEVVLRVLSQQPKRPTFKIARDLAADWRPGRPFSRPDSPQIKIYADQETLAAIATALDEELGKTSLRGGDVGPSFTKKYGATGLIFYKKEYFLHARDERAVIADGFEFLLDKQSALARAGFCGEKFYRRIGEIDPLKDDQVHELKDDELEDVTPIDYLAELAQCTEPEDLFTKLEEIRMDADVIELPQVYPLIARLNEIKGANLNNPVILIPAIDAMNALLGRLMKQPI